ncbi:transporter substrate-binding domain-containing protein [Litorilituus sediminis]|uniref:Transporter substrate-binding domain-containing protein n=1 Tax=Litorilituus sediminis TaxID=718192 RepID=A0A4P6P4Y1_9GAMM|nr:transporter substrate-binding domain-containing protein [Litorilituus sediminis]
MSLLGKHLCKYYFYSLLFGVSFFVQASEPIKVTIVADDSYPPYSYLENEEIKGIYVDIIKAAAKRIAKYYQIEIITMPWKRGLVSLENSEHFAIIPPYKRKAKRPYIWPYSTALFLETVVAFCHKDVSLEDAINSKGSQQVIQVGMNAGFLILNKELKTAQAQGLIRIWENKNTSANIMKLIFRRIDCYINDRVSTLWQLTELQKQHAEVDFSNIQETYLVMEQTAHIGYVREGIAKYPYKADFIKKMDDALLEIQKIGISNNIINKYLSHH